MKQYLLLALFGGISVSTMAQKSKKGAETAARDTVKPAAPPAWAPKPKLRPYSALITDKTISHPGLFTVHEVRDSVFFEIPDSVLTRDIMVINRLVSGPGLSGVYAGEELDEKTIIFERGLDSTINIRYDLVISEADTTSSIWKAVKNSNVNPIAVVLPILAVGNGSSVIDATNLLKSNSFINSMGQRSMFKMFSMPSKDFRVEQIHAYPQNVEIRISKIFSDFVQAPSSGVTNTSFIALPKTPMMRRTADPRIGFFSDSVFIFADDQQRTEERGFALRWRLEPRDEDIEKYKRGELVEPKKPIVFYIDPATPKQWRKYLILGINDWQKAFEKAGFKNAIQGKEWVESDSINIDDARYSFIRYLPSPIPNAYGPNVHDPRSGEIIQSHVGWYHNVMELVHDWYMIQAGAVDPRARHAKFDDELMGQLIRFVSSHEVGHTLGLAHNFGSSSQTPVEKLRDKEWLRQHGHTASIMDYARFNYVAQPEDNIPEELLFPRIGEYDQWAIKWGYSQTFAANEDADRKIVSKWATDSLKANPRLWFGDGERRKTDPRCQTEDLSDNVMKANTYGIRNLKRILPELPQWTAEEGGLRENLKQGASTLVNQYEVYIIHVLKNISGALYTVRLDQDTAAAYEPIAKAKQLEALTFLDKELFTTPTWLTNSVVLQRMLPPVSPNYLESIDYKAMNSLLIPKRLALIEGSSKRFGARSLSLEEYFTALHKMIWRELATGKAMDIYRRTVQRAYVGSLIDIIGDTNLAVIETDYYSNARAELSLLQSEIRLAQPKFTDKADKIHLEDLLIRIKRAFEAKLIK